LKVKNIKLLIDGLLMILPSKLKIIYYRKIRKWEIGDRVYIGFSFISVKRLTIGDDSRIGNLNVIKGITSLVLRGNSRLGNLNWITGFPVDNRQHFDHVCNRDPSLYILEHASITNRHLIDCTCSVTVGKYTTVGGFRSQVITHSIDFKRCIQDASPIEIGEYSFISTSVVLLPGAKVPNYSIVGAGSVVTKPLTKDFTLYGGVPANEIAQLNIDEWKYFSRTNGRVT